MYIPLNLICSIDLNRTGELSQMRNKSFIAFTLGLIWWVTGWVCINWVLNYAVYNGMTELWLIQIPFTSIDVVTSPWQAYFLSFIQIHIALVLRLEKNISKPL